MRFTVVWSKTAQSRQAELWLESKDQARFTSAANRIDQLLPADPTRHAQALGPRSYVLEVPPLMVAFSNQHIRPENRGRRH
jgi:hypothetical protein